MTVTLCHKNIHSVMMSFGSAPVILKDIAFLSLHNCSATGIRLVTIHPVSGLCAQVQRGGSSFTLQMHPREFTSFEVSEFPIPGPEGSEVFMYGVVHLSLQEEAARRIYDQFVETLRIVNMPVESVAPKNGSCSMPAASSSMSHSAPFSKHISQRVNPHNAVVIVLRDSANGKQSFKDLLQLFSVSRLVGEEDAINPAFSPQLVDHLYMEDLLAGCGESSTVINAVRLMCLYSPHSSTNFNGASDNRQSSFVISPSDQRRPVTVAVTIPLSSALASATIKPPPSNSRIVISANNSLSTDLSTPSDKNGILRRASKRKQSEAEVHVLTDDSVGEKSTPSSSVANGNGCGDSDLGVPLLCDPLPIYQRDLECLKPGYYINDTIVDFYLKYLVERYEAKLGPGKAYAFSSLFYSKLTRPTTMNSLNRSGNLDPAAQQPPAERRYENVRNWVRRLHTLFSTDYIFIPVNVNQHWMLVVVQHIAEALKKPENGHASAVDGNGNGETDQASTKAKVPAIVVLDSMASGNPIANAHYHVARYVRQFLECDARTRNLLLDSTRLRDIRPRVPQQNNATDCALYVCQYAECFLEAPPSFEPTTAPSSLDGSAVTPVRSNSPLPIAAGSSSSQDAPSMRRTQSSCVVLVVRDAESSKTTSLRRVVVPSIAASPSPTTAAAAAIVATTPSFQPSLNLTSWFPNERVAKKRQEILQLVHKLIAESPSSAAKTNKLQRSSSSTIVLSST